MNSAPHQIRVWPDYNDHTNPVSDDWSGGIWDDTNDPNGTAYTKSDLCTVTHSPYQYDSLQLPDEGLIQQTVTTYVKRDNQLLKITVKRSFTNGDYCDTMTTEVLINGQL
jgi:hypothetical protein